MLVLIIDDDSLDTSLRLIFYAIAEIKPSQ